jgi:sulfur-oxidizing protein SoxY
MNTTRRTVLKGATASSVLAGLIAAGALRPTQVLAAEWNKAAFEAHETTGALKGLGAGTPAEHKDLMIKVPDIAENGAVVPVDVVSNIPNTSLDRDSGRQESFSAVRPVRVCQWRTG